MEDDGAIGRVTPPRDAHLRDDDDAVEKIVTESVDVYLLAPEDDREIELKDFTIMKPKNNKMHRLVRYYPRCEISYRAVPPPPPEEKIVTSPNGTHTTTITTTHRHNGGFSNPSRNAEVFRLKRRLLKEYYAAIKKDPTFLSMDDETMDARSYSAGSQQYTGSAGQFNIRSTYRRPMSPANWGPSDQDHHQDGCPPSPPPLSMFPRYRRVIVGDEDYVPLTSQLMPKLSWKARANYISSLWPEIAPVDDDEEIMNYYGLEVQIISDEERKKELDAANKAAGDANETNGDRSGPAVVDAGIASPVKSEPVDAAGEEKEADDDDDDESGPEMTVETRSAAKLKDAESKILPVATKQDDWVQCDKCQKWRRLASHVNVNDLPATWYCKMNRWDKRFNKCSAPEEKVVVPMKEADLVVYRERRFAQDFLQRIKRMEKAVQQYKYSDMRDDTGERQVVTCVECFKKRALISGMDARKIAQPFVCWMNSWDEMHASCSAPQGPIPPRQIDMQANAGSSSGGGIGAAGDDGKSQSGGAGAKNTGGASSIASKKGSSSKPSSGNGSSSKPAAKRKPSDSSATSGDKTSGAGGNGGGDKATSSSGNAKKPKRR